MNGRYGAPNGGDFNERLVATLDALKSGDFSARLPLGRSGLEGTIADARTRIAAKVQLPERTGIVGPQTACRVPSILPGLWSRA